MAKNAQPSTVDTIAANCVAVRLRRLNRIVTNFYDEALRPLGVKISQLNILVVVAKLGLARPAKICEMLELDASTLSRNVDRMLANGWLEVVAEADGRTQPVRLTPQGRKLIARATPGWEAGQRRARALFGDDGLALLGRAAQARPGGRRAIDG